MVVLHKTFVNTQFRDCALVVLSRRNPPASLKALILEAAIPRLTEVQVNLSASGPPK